MTKPTREIQYFALYAPKCTSCSHLVDGAKKTYSKCHFSKGNTECPASEVRWVAVGKAQLYARKVIKARRKRDTAAEAKLLQYVSAQSAAFQSKFHEALNNI